MAVIDRVIQKLSIVIPDTIQKQVLEQLYINHMGMEKTKSLQVNQYIEKVFIVILKNI